jgi:hypothetical protein
VSKKKELEVKSDLPEPFKPNYNEPLSAVKAKFAGVDRRWDGVPAKVNVIDRAEVSRIQWARRGKDGR